MLEPSFCRGARNKINGYKMNAKDKELQDYIEKMSRHLNEGTKNRTERKQVKYDAAKVNHIKNKISPKYRAGATARMIVNSKCNKKIKTPKAHEYNKACNKCGTAITLIGYGGSYRAYNKDKTIHKCNRIKIQVFIDKSNQIN